MKFSDICCLLRITAYVLRFAARMRGHPVEVNSINFSLLSSSEIKAAELTWIGVIQSKTFPVEIQFLLTNKEPKPLLVRQFGLYLDEVDHVIRCRGQINNSSLPSNSKNPILLPHSHHLVKLIIRRAHARLMHSGVRETLVLLREQYWIL